MDVVVDMDERYYNSDGSPLFNSALGDRVCRRPGLERDRTTRGVTRVFEEAMLYAERRAQATGHRQRIIRSKSTKWFLCIVLDEEISNVK